MKQFIFTTLCLLVSLCGYGQTAMVEVTHSKPYQYEKRNGQLQIQATVHLPGTHPPGIQVWLDGKPVEVANASDNKLTVWLPLIGEDKLLQIASGKQKKMIAEQLYTPLIPPNWDYFQNGTIHIISSSHQDIAWMNTPDSCRHERIYDIINPAMQMMDTDQNFAFGMEQTLNLREFLDEFPNRKEEVIRRYKEGRFAWGATYNQPYEGLESSEQLVR